MKKILITSGNLLLPVFIILSAAIFTTCTPNKKTMALPTARGGIIDLTQWDLSGGEIVPLDGEWQFAWGVTEPELFMEQNDQSKGSIYAPVPGVWTEYSGTHSRFPVTGTAILTLTIHFGAGVPDRLALRIPSVDTAFRVYINGSLRYQNGDTGTTADTSKPRMYAPVIVDIAPGKTARLVFFLSNFHYPRPGIRDSILLGESGIIDSHSKNLLVKDIFLVGAIFIMALYHLGLFYLRRSDRSPFYFALFCLSTAGRLLITGEGYAYSLGLIEWQTGTFLEYMLFYACVVTFAMYMRSLYPHEIGRRTVLFIAVVCAGFSLFTLMTPAMIYARGLIYFNIFLGIMIVYFMVLLGITLIRRREAAKIFLVGSIALFAAAINDMLYNARVLNTAYVMPYGLYFFFFVQSFILSMRFSKAFNMFEDLSRTLEAKVEERTIELETERLTLDAWKKNIEKEIDLARKIQEQIIPVATPSDRIAALYKPMSEVGGDFYDFIKFKDDNKLGFFISDVSGHGIPAAFITTVLKTIILQAGERLKDPAGLLHYVNEMIHNLAGGYFCTVFYGIFDPADRYLVYSNAGHNHPYIITRDSVWQLEVANGLPAGAMNESFMRRLNKPYINQSCILPYESKILLYTDGLSEARTRLGETDQVFENNGLKEALYALRNERCHTFVRKLYGLLQDYRGTDSMEDDVCMICIEVE